MPRSLNAVFLWLEVELLAEDVLVDALIEPLDGALACCRVH